MGWSNGPPGWSEMERVLSGKPRRSGTPTVWTPADEAPWSRKRIAYQPPDEDRPIRSSVPYAELHAHSAYSFLDGASAPEELIEEAVRLGLRAIAPTVAVSAVAPARMLEVLRESGYAPAAESTTGEVVTLFSEPERAPSRPASRGVRLRTAGIEAPQLAEAVRRMRAGDALAEVSRRVSPEGQRVPGVTTAGMLELLREAIRGERRIWLDHVDAQGRSQQRALDPISMAGGTLRGYDPDSGRLESFALHHITAVSVLPD